MADSVRYLSQSDSSICIGILAEFYLLSINGTRSWSIFDTGIIFVITPTTEKTLPLDSEDDFRSGCRNISRQPYPNVHTRRTTDTLGFKSFTVE